MRDLSLQASGALAIFVAIIHGAIAELGVFPKVRIESRRALTLLRIVWQGGALDWICIGVLLMATPAVGSETARRWIVAVAVACSYGAVGNVVVSRGRHIGGT